MELKTKIQADEGKHDLLITREFDLPVELLFKAYTEAKFVAQWMDTTVLKLESKNYGAYEFEKRDQHGNIIFSAHGVIHELKPDEMISRTFEMGNAPFGVQLEICKFHKLTDGTSKLTIHTIYESPEKRDQLLKLPFAQGLNYAHKRLEDLMSKLNKCDK